ncbi:CDP-diacylglycerol--glycerol-3-phosphate 3-phosphatidyltransferase, mitochondrial isoform X3 [Phymastichus coffea]|uniref:CDP-diacylglycerol--glycerol-3-phosphate 3-phosphatidyltransferase, mitochondrial isoform X3 n=1 Tax=Phymastichus coffea TaxID=108790 RepID=UPI00273A7A07|nr:CDP-diacylglycerol--glycerol-3-phosphate 3-phosphatidyltransferase, mitochondrial isoform X3 [Phymastichus coffea]
MLSLPICVKSLRRFLNSKLRRHKLSISIIRCKMHSAALEVEKISDIEIVQVESTSLTWLHKVAPAFPIDGSKIKIIYEPSEFYFTLLEKCKFAKKRITLASLYLGTGKLEQELVNSIKHAIENNNGNIEVNILLDYMRGSRGKFNSKEMLKSLLNEKYKKCCQAYLYHTPRLRGLFKTFIPDRFNELIGLQHMKLYIFDNTLIISGFQLLPDGNTSFSTKVKSHPFKSPSNEFTQEAADRILNLFQTEMDKRSELYKTEIPKADTWIFPLVQMGQLNIRHDSEITLKLLQTAPSGATLRLATGYFNLTTEYKNALVNACQADCHVLTAHPKANGFFGARGVAGGIPAAYTKIEESFFKLCEQMQQNSRIRLWEYVKPGWTYHAKGLWYSMPGQQRPSFTLIGSPNFGYRSVKRDLETQIAIATKNEELRNRLQKEQERLFDCAKSVTESTFLQKERLPPAWVRMAVFFFRYYF